MKPTSRLAVAPTEWAQLRETQILFTYLHLAADHAQADGLLNSGCAAIVSIDAATSVPRRPGGSLGLLLRLRYLDEMLGGRVKTRYSTIDAIDEEIRHMREGAVLSARRWLGPDATR
jgi:alanine dehydrogenase